MRHISCHNKDYLNDTLMYFFGILIWPIILIIVSNSLYEDCKVSKTNEKSEKFEFELQIADLVEKVDKCEIERREVVYDPLKAVPSIPFGHLNSVWLKFCEGLEIQDDLWTFDLLWESPWGAKIRYAGYAAVRNNTIVNILYTR